MTGKKKPQVCIIYPADPLGAVASGIDTFIRGVLAWAPDDIGFSVVGATTDESARPLRQWQSCRLGGKSFEFFPVIRLRKSERQARIPATLKFLAALAMHRIGIKADLLEFHRIEPALALLRDRRPKTCVMHQNMKNITSAGSDIRWKHLPSLYFRLEDYLLPKFSRVYCVREDATLAYREKFPTLADRILFTPTWVDTTIFYPPSSEERSRGREQLRQQWGFPEDALILVTVGRLDKQKNPLLLLDAFRKLGETRPNARLLYVGDGVLRGQLENRLKTYGLESKVRLCGVQSVETVARYLRFADLFVLSSAYEGMPMCVLEALGSGLPVASTNVGEVNRVVHSGLNGELIATQKADDLADAIVRCDMNIEGYQGQPCVEAIQDYIPAKVLAPVYENYRRLTSR